MKSSLYINVAGTGRRSSVKVASCSGCAGTILLFQKLIAKGNMEPTASQFVLDAPAWEDQVCVHRRKSERACEQARANVPLYTSDTDRL